MRKTFTAFALTAALALGACTGASIAVQNDVLAAEQSLTTAEQVALIYTSLPRCGTPGASSICSDPTMVAKIKALDDQAYAAVKAAEQNQALLSNALAAISSLVAATPKAGS